MTSEIPMFMGYLGATVLVLALLVSICLEIKMTWEYNQDRKHHAEEMEKIERENAEYEKEKSEEDNA